MADNRYDRQTRLRDFGERGQAALTNAKVLVVGLGGLGLPVVQYLNAMGVGTLGLMDQDTVELHNLQRQVLYSEDDINRLKLDVVLEKLEQQNSETVFKPFDTFLTKQNALTIIQDFDVVVDATDNFPTRYLINDACVILGKPFVYGALHGFEGHLSVFNHQDGPTYRCLYPKMPNPQEVPDCNDNGVLGVVPGIMGTLQALETVKVITGIGEVLSGELMVFDGLTQRMSKMKFQTIAEHKKRKKLEEFYDPLDCVTATTIDPKVFRDIRTTQEITLVDVRSAKEFSASHLPEAEHIPLDQLGQRPIPIPASNKVYLICQSGKRSGIAAKQLQTIYPNIEFCSILGGMNKVLPLVTDIQ
ncbi:HesA/MoeB/ThiF family protein [Flagellimonas flava]|uniref:Molybdopterin-synthase adenylyltransferase n=1 Tax=Flagellimonas flava TaxID=570519 RepID=A0A1M5ITL8_9FLAO|nr:HesA/MoeB/ThiF family protein [Allomuricauda flava]SHG31379.1 adenylyltransferase and sulfurtransferase [Allomuricauda flava]